MRIAVGLAVGAAVELATLYTVYSGANLFHGGHPHPIAALLLPGAIIVDHLSDRVPTMVPVSLMLLSLAQCPVYGAIAARDSATGRLSRAAKAVLVLHLAAFSVAAYARVLDIRWQHATEAYGACRRANPDAEAFAQTSAAIVGTVREIDTLQQDLARLRAEKARGAVFMPDPEEARRRTLAAQEAELARQWSLYVASGGTAASPREVTAAASPCGIAPRRPVIV